MVQYKQMHSHIYQATVRILFGALGLAAIIVQLMSSIEHGRNLVNFFSFFTIESNILAVVLLLLLGIAGLTKTKREFATTRGAITLYMTMTGIIYVLLLSGNEVALQTTIPWVNIVLHYVMPAVILLDWLAFPPTRHVYMRHAAIWLAFPVLYVAYSLIRGGFTEWYPYPFLNPIENGWPTVVAMCIIIGLSTSTLAGLLTLRTPRAPAER